MFKGSEIKAFVKEDKTLVLLPGQMFKFGDDGCYHTPCMYDFIFFINEMKGHPKTMEECIEDCAKHALMLINNKVDERIFYMEMLLATRILQLGMILNNNLKISHDNA